MLTLTDNAVEAIRDVTGGRAEKPEIAGVRIAPQSDGMQLGMSLTGGPEADDQVIATPDGCVYLSSDAADMLADQTLDAERTPQGGINFRVYPGSTPADHQA